jgi:YHS domain-containing protein
MKQFKILATAFSVMLLAMVTVHAADAEEGPAKELPKELKNQTHCPVMGGKIDSAVFTDVQGQRVYHCCPMCSDKLKNDPDKYFEKAAEEGVLFENIQATCPVSGEKLEDKSVYSDSKGRRIAFCSEKCRETFNEDPKKFLSKMDTPSKMEEDQVEKSPTGHEGHNH